MSKKKCNTASWFYCNSCNNTVIQRGGKVKEECSCKSDIDWERLGRCECIKWKTSFTKVACDRIQTRKYDIKIKQLQKKNMIKKAQISGLMEDSEDSNEDFDNIPKKTTRRRNNNVESELNVREESELNVREESDPIVPEESESNVDVESDPIVPDESDPIVPEESESNVDVESELNIDVESEPIVHEESELNVDVESDLNVDIDGETSNDEESNILQLNVENNLDNSEILSEEEEDFITFGDEVPKSIDLKLSIDINNDSIVADSLVELHNTLYINNKSDLEVSNIKKIKV